MITNIVSVDDVKSETSYTASGLGLDSVTFDNLIERLIKRETLRVQEEIDVSFGEKTETFLIERQESVGEYFLPLPERPVKSLDSISVDLERAKRNKDIEVSDVIVKETHLELKPERGDFPTTRRSIEVKYTFGYSSSDVPEVVEGAVVGLVRQAIKEIESDGVLEESIEGQSVDYEMPEKVIERHLGRARQFDEPNFYGGTQVI
jgi:hypothetical protein